VSARGRAVALVLLTAVALVAAALLAARPRLREADRLDTQITATAAEARRTQATLDRLLRAEAQEPALRAAVRRLEAALPGRPRHPALLRQLAAAPGARFVRLELADAAARPPAAAAGPTAVTLEAVFRGTYPQVRRTVAALHDAVAPRAGGLRLDGRLLRIAGVDLEPAEDGPGLRAVIDLRAFVARPAPAAAVATAASVPAPATAAGRGGDPFAAPAPATTKPESPPVQAIRVPRALRELRAGATVPTATDPPSPPATPVTRAPEARPAATPRSWTVEAVDLRVGTAARRDVERLAPLPSARRPLAVLAGLLRTRGAVALTVLPGVRVRGGRCVPSARACASVTLRPGQAAVLRGPSGGPVTIRLAAIRRRTVGSRADALAARRRESPAGRCLLTAFGQLDGAYMAGRGTLRWDAVPGACP
jgi:hypothetical protein